MKPHPTDSQGEQMMSYRVSDNEDGERRDFATTDMPESLRAETREAFREWLDASRAWSTLRQFIQANGDSPSARRRLEELERRLNAAAEAFDHAQERLNRPPFSLR